MVKFKGGKSSEKSIKISKGIIYTFFTVYLVVYGIGISIFIENYEGPLPLFLSYLPLLCFVALWFCGIQGSFDGTHLYSIVLPSVDFPRFFRTF